MRSRVASSWPVGFLVGLAFVAAVARGETPTAGTESPCPSRSVEERLAAGKAPEARLEATALLEREPGDPCRRLELARVYLAEGNLFWAERILTEGLELDPEEHRFRHWLAWVHLLEGDVELGRRALGADAENLAGPERTRRSLLEAFAARLESNPDEARRAIFSVGRLAPRYREDAKALDWLRRVADPGWIDPLELRLDLAGGWTSDALAGAPTDPGASGEASSLGRFAVGAKLSSAEGAFRPFAELDATGNGFSSEDARSVNRMASGLRAGILLGRESLRTSLSWRYDELRVDRPSRPEFHRGHRLEIDVERPGLGVLFGGIGRRKFRDDQRSRYEADVAVGGSAAVSGRLRLAWGFSARGHLAESEAFDLLGATATGVLLFDLGAGFELRNRLATLYDSYPHSGGELGLETFGTGEERRDLATQLSVGLWRSVGQGLRVGVSWEGSLRDSTADETPGFDYDYRENRFLVELRFRFRADPRAPKPDEAERHVPLDWGIDDGGRSEERIRDLLRQDEDLVKGSSCGIGS